MKNIINNQCGFTIVELLIGMVLMGLIMGGVFNIMGGTVGSYLSSKEYGEMTQNTRNVMALITKEIQNAQAITSPNSTTAKNTLTYSTYNSVTDTIENRTIKIVDGSTSKIEIAGKQYDVGKNVTLSFAQDNDANLVKSGERKVIITVNISVKNKKGTVYKFAQNAMTLNNIKS